LNDDSAIYTAYDDFKGMDSAEAEKNLMRAILKSAMDDIRKRGEPSKEALTYFLSEEDYYLFSFLSVCRHLGLCPRTIRTMVGLMDTESRSIDADYAAA
jgi:hypothetical protein